MFKKFATLAAVGVLAASSSAFAIDHETQKWELMLSGQGTNDNDFNNGSFSVTAQVGYFFSDQLEVAVRQSAAYGDSEGGDSSWAGSTRVGAFYHFNMDKAQVWVPYVGASVGYNYGDVGDDSWIAGPEAGIRYYVNSTTFVQANISYDFLLQESVSDGVISYGLGIGFQW
jgi:outer membrane protein W